MRKVLSIVLVLALVLGSTAFTFGAVPSDVSGTKYEDAVNVLMELDVISGYPDGSYKPAGIVTRGEMAKIIVCALGLEDYAAGSSSFSDMAGHWADKYVAYAVSLGIINGYPDGTFKADNTVTYDEAAKMLVAALGYTEAGLIGTWPANWVTKAKTLGILDGIKTAGATGANRGDIALMAFQTLNKAIGKVNNDGDWVAATPADTMLIRLDAKLYDPGADAYDSGLVVTAGAAFVVTGEEDSVISLKELQGALITAYANDDDEIIAVKEVKSQFYTGEIDGLSGAGVVFAGGEEIGDYEVKAAAIPAAASTETYTFKNGADASAEVAAATYTNGDEVTIACDISGKYITKIYSIAIWDLTQGANFQFEEDDLEDDSIKSIEFELDNNDEIDMDSFALFGVNSLEDIKEDDVVYVYHDGASTPKVTRIEVGTEVVEGEITKINSASTKITVGGKVYELSTASGADPNGVWPLAVENEVKLVLDYAGKVYDLEKVSGSADKLAVILDIANEVPGLAGNEAMIKLLLEDGTSKVFDAVVDDIAAAFINASGAWQTGADDGTDASKGSVIKYSINSDGEVDAIEAIEAGLHVVSASPKTGDVSKAGYFDGYKIASDATIIVVDAIATFSADADNYEFTGRDAVLGVNISATYVLKNGLITAMVVDSASTSDDEIYGVFVGKARVSGGTTYEVTMLVDGKEVVYAATSAGYTAVDKAYGGAPAINAEDQLQRLIFNASGELKDTLSAFNGLASPADGFATADADVNTVTLTAAAKTITIKNNVATITGTVDAKLHDWSGFTSGDDITVASDAAIYKVNSDGDWVKGSINDLKLTASTKTVAFFDVYGDDKIADVVVIK
jgi:hypothetical protein